MDTIQNPRLRRLKDRTFACKYGIQYVPGCSKAIKVSDALSRNAIEKEKDHGFKEVEEAAKTHAILQCDQIESIKRRKVNEAAAVCEECAALARLIIDGFQADKTLLTTNLQPYYGMKDGLYLRKMFHLRAPKC